MTRICFEVPENERGLIKTAREIDGVEVKKIHPVGATEYIAIFVPIGVALLETIPEILVTLMAKKEVIVKVKGRTMHGTPQQIVNAIKEMPQIREELKKLMDENQIEIDGTSKNVAETEKLLYDYSEKESDDK